MRICFFGAFKMGPGYPVNRYLIHGLTSVGCPPDICHVELWEGPLYATVSRLGPGNGVRLALRACSGYARLIWKYLRAPAHDWVLVGYPGYWDVHLARLLRFGRRRRIGLIAFISLYDTVVLDRARLDAASWRACVLRWIDRLAFRAADVVLVDTFAQARFYAATFGLEQERFRRSFVGHEFAGEHSGTPAVRRGAAGSLRVLFFGTYVPLHGIHVIVDAANLLRDEDIEFTLIGRGQLLDDVLQHVRQRQLERVRLVTEWLEAEALRAQVEGASVCLGIFGTTAKAARVIPYKVLGALALARPVVTRDSPAIRELLVPDESVILCPAGAPEALARALLRLHRDPALRQRLAVSGHQAYLRQGTPRAVGRTLLSTLEERLDAS